MKEKIKEFFGNNDVEIKIEMTKLGIYTTGILLGYFMGSRKTKHKTEIIFLNHRR